MKRRRHTPEQIIRKLREADRLLAEGHDVPEVAKHLEISEATYHRWRAQYGGLKPTMSSGSRSWRASTPG
jgi:putative transposase